MIFTLGLVLFLAALVVDRVVYDGHSVYVNSPGATAVAVVGVLGMALCLVSVCILTWRWMP